MSNPDADPWASPLSTAAPDEVALLDDPQEWSAFGKPCASTPAGADAQAGPWESHVVLDGMHCAACALTIEEALRRVPGVAEADVSAATRRARVVWDPRRVRPSQWMGAVQKAGYRALPALDALAREQRQRAGVCARRRQGGGD